ASGAIKSTRAPAASRVRNGLDSSICSTPSVARSAIRTSVRSGPSVMAELFPVRPGPIEARPMRRTCPAEHPRAAMFGLHPQMARHAGAWLDLVIAMVLPREHGAPVWPTPASGRLMPVVHREDQMFRDRVDAGRQLAEKLASEAFSDPVIL